MRLLFIVDPLERLALAGDTSYALMLEARARGHEVFTCQIDHLGLAGDEAIAEVSATEVRQAEAPAQAFTRGPLHTMRLADLDVVAMRKDPPFDVAYLHATWILDFARGKTVLVNDPRGLRELNEHLAVLRFPALTPPTIVTRSAEKLHEFLAAQGGAIVVKPVDGYGGLGVLVVRAGDPNTSSMFEISTQAGTRWTMAQKYLPEAKAGDKRIVLADGEPVGAVLRVPGPAEARGNLHVGGSPHKTSIDARDAEIIVAVAPMLRRYGQVLVGLDVIGGQLTEINITSPTGVRQASALDGVNVAGAILDCFERLARERVA